MIGMKFASALDQHFFSLGDVWIRNAAVDRAYRRALFLIEEADALGALVRSYIVDVFLDCRVTLTVEFPLRPAFIDRGVRTFGLTRPAVYAFLCDYGGHTSV